MDNFLEYLMKKKPTQSESFLKVVIVAVAVFVTWFIFNLLLAIPQLSTFSLLGAVLIVYGAYVLLRNLDIEYEYIFTNGELDIDVIKGKRVRKRLISVNSKELELMAREDDSVFGAEFKSESIVRTYDAVYDKNAGEIYCIIFDNEGVRSKIDFQPPKALLEAMAKYNPRAIHK